MQFIRIIGAWNKKEQVSTESFWLGSENPEWTFGEEVFLNNFSDIKPSISSCQHILSFPLVWSKTLCACMKFFSPKFFTETYSWLEGEEIRDGQPSSNQAVHVPSRFSRRNHCHWDLLMAACREVLMRKRLGKWENTFFVAWIVHPLYKYEQCKQGPPYVCHGKETKTIMEGASLMVLAHCQQKGQKITPLPKVQGASWCWSRGRHYIHWYKTVSHQLLWFMGAAAVQAHFKTKGIKKKFYVSCVLIFVVMNSALFPFGTFRFSSKY